MMVYGSGSLTQVGLHSIGKHKKKSCIQPSRASAAGRGPVVLLK